MSESSINRQAVGLMKFIGMSAVLLLALTVLNWMPLSVQKSSVHTFTSIEEAKSQLGIRLVHVPVYFPEHLSWPPSQVIGQIKPHEALVFIIEDKASHEPALVVSQSASGEFDAAGRADVTMPSEVTSIPIKSRAATLKAGDCGNIKCSSIAWQEPDGKSVIHMKVLIMGSTTVELVRIAESMVQQ